MNELFDYIAKNGLGADDQAARIFLEFKYPEIRDLLKQFLTLISASLVLSITFAEKIVNFETATLTQKSVLVGSWGSLITALGACGLGIYTMYMTAEEALNVIAGAPSQKFYAMANYSYLFQDLSGILFGLGLLTMVAASVIQKF